jgi:excisionase family DNA binding protein
MPDPLDQAALDLRIPAALVDALADAVADRLVHRPNARSSEPVSSWLTFEQARQYLGFSRHTLYKLTAARAIPLRKKQGGQGLRFHRDELDQWMREQYPRLDRLG